MNHNIRRGLVAVGALVAAGASQAAITVDTTVISGDATTAVASVGAAVFALTVGIKVYKWIRRAL
jgi:ribonuclease PH